MSSFDEQMLKMADFAMERIFAPPTPRHKERFQDFDLNEQRRIVDHWMTRQGDRDAYILDSITDLDLDQLMKHFLAGDRAEVGLMFERAMLANGRRIDADAEYWERT